MNEWNMWVSESYVTLKSYKVLYSSTIELQRVWEVAKWEINLEFKKKDK